MPLQSRAFREHGAFAVNRAAASLNAGMHAVSAALRIATSLAVASIAAAALAGCGQAGVGALMVDPARYEGYHCNDLASQWKVLASREKQLRNFIDRANDGGAGNVIGAVAYRGDYETVLEQEKFLQRAAAAQNCQLVVTYSSDQGIR